MSDRNPITIDLGCGNDKKEGSYGIDFKKVRGADIFCDIGKGLPLKNNSVDKIYTRHFLEHVPEPLSVIEETYRVLKPKGIFEVIVPHWSWYGSHTFMHRTFFHSKDFDFLEPESSYNYYTASAFRIKHIEIRYFKGTNRWWSRPFAKLINKLLNWNRMYSEQFLVSIIMPEEIYAVLEKVEKNAK